MKGSTLDAGVRWQARPGLALAVRALAALLPVAVAAAAALTVARMLPPGTNPIGWWALVTAAAITALSLVDVVTRKLLPLAVLLRLSLVFPDRAPSRLGVALRTGSIKRLREQAGSAADRGEDASHAAADILALAAALSAHDRATRGHSERVRAYAELTAMEMGLDGHDRERLRWAALLHDIGKLTVPAATLNTHQPLRDDEWANLKRHPEEGAHLASPLAGWLGDHAGAIGEHHERFDGAGYPRGLKGQEISLAARIVAVADSYDAMTSVRSYNEVMTPYAARQELARKAGTHFDPEVVRAFLAISLGRLRWMLGPAALLAGTPLLLGWNQLHRALGTASRTVTLGATSIAATLALTAVGLPSPPRLLEMVSPPRPRRAELAAAPRLPGVLPLSEPVVAAAPTAPPAAASLTLGFRSDGAAAASRARRSVPAVAPTTATPAVLAVSAAPVAPPPAAAVELPAPPAPAPSPVADAPRTALAVPAPEPTRAPAPARRRAGDTARRDRPDRQAAAPSFTPPPSSPPPPHAAPPAPDTAPGFERNGGGRHSENRGGADGRGPGTGHGGRPSR